MLNQFKSNKYNIKMEQIKSPKSLAYARLGKPQSGKISARDQQQKIKRNSTGNIYEEILQQIHPEANSYIRNLVNKNEKQVVDPRNIEMFHSRRKSYAEIMIESSSKERQRKERAREERDTLCRPKFTVDNDFLQKQITPKNSTIPINKWTSASKNSINMSQSNKIMINSFKNEPEGNQQSFLSNLTNYLEELSEVPEKNVKANYNGIEKLSQTLKINSNQSDSFKLVAKLEQSHLKIKELKFKNHYQQKEINKFNKKQQKMKESLFEMLGQIKHLTAQLSYEKKQRKKLEKIIDSFQLRRNELLERKTIGKNYLRLQEFESDFNLESEYDRDCDSSFREYLKNATDKKKHFNHIRIYDDENDGIHGILDSEKIEKLFRSHQNSDQSDF